MINELPQYKNRTVVMLLADKCGRRTFGQLFISHLIIVGRYMDLFRLFFIAIVIHQSFKELNL